jgi:hypothetical protein
MLPLHDLFQISIYSLGEENGFKSNHKTDDTRGCDGSDLFSQGSKGAEMG